MKPTFVYLFTYLLFSDNDDKFSDEAQEKPRRDTMPQRHKHERYKVGDEFISKETEPFV